ncbi:MAG: CotH kinase family protein [Eubacteriales bacterium]
MLRSKYTTIICVIVTAAMLVMTVLFMSGETLGLTAAHADPQYVDKLFSTDKVHELDITVEEEDWWEMLDSATSKEYIMCDVVIDGNTVKNVAIRPKGNSSLSSIASSDTDRYSFKLEFDHYNSTQTYFGLDKLALNNITQDNTYLKDYISYQMMNESKADAPLSSFIYIKVNGEDWGLYLAVEGIEESFAQRSYGSDYGEIYKPDSMDMMAGRGDNEDGQAGGQFPVGFADGELPEFPQDGQAQQGRGRRRPNLPQDGQMPDGGQAPPEGQAIPDFLADIDQGDDSTGQGNAFPNAGGNFAGNGGMRPGSSDVALRYSDDNVESYPNIFDNAVFDPTEADKKRLIASIKAMNEGDMEASVNVDEVLRYFVVHNFVLNFDSYTGSMLHNYYLYEEDGLLSMIAWDYNLAFGAFSMGGNNSSAGMDSASVLINYPIDTPTSGTTMENIPLLNNLLTNEDYLARYHELFSQFISGYFESGEFEQMYDNAVALISPYVEKDPTAFCTYEEFRQAQQTLKQFCLLRAQSVKGQLDGTIAATTQAQSSTQNAGFVDASGIDISVMGSNMQGFERGRDTAAVQNWSGQNMPSGGTQLSAPDGAGNTSQSGTAGQDTTESGDGQSDLTSSVSAEGEASGGEIQAGKDVLRQNTRQVSPVSQEDTTGWADKQTLILLTISAGVAAFGLIFARFYKV